MEDFSEDERRLLEPFVSNLDRPVFALIGLPEVVKGALFSRYSRSAKSLRRVLLDEFMLSPELGLKEMLNAESAKKPDFVKTKKAEEFYDRVLVGYGDDSVAELAGAHLAMEDISILATKIVEDARIGLSPLEKSTRYVYFDNKRDGKWLYLREKTLMDSGFAGLYEKTCDHCFQTYADLIPKVSAYVMERTPRDEKTSERAYNSTIRAKTCDILRGLLPASTLTNMGFFGDGRAFEYLLTRMYGSGLAEVKGLAGSMQKELSSVIPSFVRRA
ncbi:MAG: FAD-dependent thymidylate synthase, partial [Candidatus Micrarchaeota archaeon]